jgi:ribosomal protein L29
MTILKYKDILNMNDKARKSKMKDLRIELIKAQVTSHRTNAKTKEIKKAIARLLTFDKTVERQKESKK